MKRLLFGVMAIAACTVLGQGLSLSDARAKVGDAIADPSVMAATTQQLSADDQVKFLADVNEAISKMPGSAETKAAAYLDANRAALKTASKGNLSAVLAEVFATVPPESLTVLNERFAVDLVNRAGDPSIVFTDEQYTKIALDLMNVVNERMEEADSGSTRAAFAILMLVRASNGTPEDLADKLIDTLKHEDARDLAKTEWIPAALGKDGRKLGYEPILASADAGRRPDFAYVLVIAGPQFHISILEDIVGKNTDEYSFIRTRTPVLDAVENPLIHAIPTLGQDVFGSDMPPPPQEPRPYYW